MENPKIFLKIELDSTRAFKDLGVGERLFNERKINEALEFFIKIEKESEIFKKSYYVITGIMTFGVGLPLVGGVLADSLDPVYKGLGHCYFWKKQYLESIKYFNKVYNKDYTDNYIMGWAYYSVGEVDKSKNLFKNSYNQNPDMLAYIPNL